MTRSLIASPEGLKKAKQRLKTKGYTKQELAIKLEISRDTVSKFFNPRRGKKIDRYYFEKICKKLDLDPEEISAKPTHEDEPEAFEERYKIPDFMRREDVIANLRNLITKPGKKVIEIYGYLKEIILRIFATN